MSIRCEDIDLKLVVDDVDTVEFAFRYAAMISPAKPAPTRMQDLPYTPTCGQSGCIPLPEVIHNLLPDAYQPDADAGRLGGDVSLGGPDQIRVERSAETAVGCNHNENEFLDIARHDQLGGLNVAICARSPSISFILRA